MQRANDSQTSLDIFYNKYCMTIHAEQHLKDVIARTWLIYGPQIK